MTSDAENGKIGPHEGIELALMLSNQKPLACFSDDGVADLDLYPRADFDSLVEQGRFVRSVLQDRVDGRDGTVTVTTTMYALPQEAWRIEALRLVNVVYQSQSSGWRPDLERMIGALLGYRPEDVEAFLAHVTAG